MPNFLKQRLFITPWYAHECAYQGIINNRFCRKSQKFLFSSFDKILIRKNKCIDLPKARVILSLRIWQLYLYFKLEPRKQGILFQIFVWVLESPYGATSIIQKDSINAENAWKKILSWGGSICQTHMIACLMNLRNLCLGSVPFTRYKSCIFLLEEFLHSFYVTLPCLCKQDKRVNFFMYFSYILLDLWMMGVCSIVFVFSKKKKNTKKTSFIFKICFWFYGRVYFGRQIMVCPKSV